MEAVSTGYICPACGFDDLDEPPWEGKRSSLEICPSCGIQFGYTDDAGGDPRAREELHKEWREAWIRGGMKWSSPGQTPPPNWDPVRQVSRVSPEAGV